MSFSGGNYQLQSIIPEREHQLICRLDSHRPPHEERPGSHFPKATCSLSLWRRKGREKLLKKVVIVQRIMRSQPSGFTVVIKLKLSKNMKVEIWSDVMCPFCYIGKRRFENALAQFDHKDKVEVIWKSYQLNPDMKTEPGKNINQYLSETKGWSLEQARQANDHVTKIAKEAGLDYNMDKAIVANSFDAHRLVQLAKTTGKGDAMEEQLFKAYFTEGKNTADHDTLVQLATAIGLDAGTVKKVLDSDEYADAVEQDIYESQQIGVRGVPFFVLNDRYAVSGAQAVETFAGALDQAWSEWEKEAVTVNDVIDNGAVCNTDGEC
jgi:predicted DsbA family dithiol-disulfide isomerase